MRLEIWLQSSLENAAYHRPIRPFAVSPSPALFSAEPSAPLKVCPDMTRLCCVIDTHLPTIPHCTTPRSALFVSNMPGGLWTPRELAPQTPFLGSLSAVTSVPSSRWRRRPSTGRPSTHLAVSPVQSAVSSDHGPCSVGPVTRASAPRLCCSKCGPQPGRAHPPPGCCRGGRASCLPFDPLNPHSNKIHADVSACWSPRGCFRGHLWLPSEGV